MTTSAKTELVECVARAICDNDHGPGSSSAWNLHFGEYRGSARAAILSTLQYLRDNVSEKMEEAFREAAFSYREGGWISANDGAQSVLQAAIEEIEGA